MRRLIVSPWSVADQQPDRIAVIRADEGRTFGELVARAEDYIVDLRGRGVADGEVVATDLPPGFEFFALCLAALYGGFGLFPITRGTNPEVRRTMLESAGVRLDVLSDGPGRGLRHIRPEAVPRRAGGESVEPAHRAGYLVLTTSGTTGAQQAVKRPRPWYPYKGVAVLPRYAAGPDRGAHVMSSPMYNLGTLGPALYALQAGSAVAVLPEWSPGAFWDLVDAAAADSAYLPNRFLADVVSRFREPARRLALVMHGGTACPPVVKRRAIDLLGPVVHEYYGTSQGVVSEITAHEWLRYPGSVGRPLPGVAVSIDRNGAPVPIGEIGEVFVTPRSIDGPTGGGKLAVGDVGRLNEEGYLFILGRVTPGLTEMQAAMESLVRALAGVTDAAVMYLDGAPPRCLVEVDDAHAATIRSEVRALARELGIKEMSIRVGRTGSFPRTDTGKIRRVAVEKGTMTS